MTQTIESLQMDVESARSRAETAERQRDEYKAERDKLADLLAEWKTYYGSCEKEHCHSCLTHITARALEAS